MALAGLWVQLFLALGWTVYVIFLPALAAQAGIAKEWVPWLLLADQAIFAAMDWLLGTRADRVAGAMGRLANAILLASLLSCGAFLLLPFAAPSGSPTPICCRPVYSGSTGFGVVATSYDHSATATNTSNGSTVANSWPRM
mgnify:CR=1 FL=1